MNRGGETETITCAAALIRLAAPAFAPALWLYVLYCYCEAGVNYILEVELMRLFIGLAIDERLRGQLAALLAALQEENAGSGIKWVPAANLHLTLLFLGEVEAGALKPLASACRETLAGIKPFALSFAGLGAFPSLDRPRVLWCAVQQGSSELQKIHAALRGALVRRGWTLPDGRFHPHLTLARIKKAGSFSGRPAGGHSFQTSCMRVDRVTCFQSVLRPTGPLYTAIDQFLL